MRIVNLEIPVNGRFAEDASFMSMSEEESRCYEDEQRRWELLAAIEGFEATPVGQLAMWGDLDYRTFVSRSKGRAGKRLLAKGIRSRIRRRWVELEFLTYYARIYPIKDGGGGIDEIASEIMGDFAQPEDCERKLLDLARQIPWYKKMVRERVVEAVF